MRELHYKSKQGNLGFGGLNSWQPLGYVTYPGDTFIVYVGQEGKRNGQAVNLQLVYSQYHAESASFVSSPISLKVGKNEISMKELQSIGVEKGGSVYVQYTGNSNEKIAVRVSGGEKIATLDLYQVIFKVYKHKLIKWLQNTKNFIVMTIVLTMIMTRKIVF